jgi:hypothetical protein
VSDLFNFETTKFAINTIKTFKEEEISDESPFIELLISVNREAIQQNYLNSIIKSDAKKVYYADTPSIDGKINVSQAIFNKFCIQMIENHLGESSENIWLYKEGMPVNIFTFQKKI